MKSIIYNNTKDGQRTKIPFHFKQHINSVFLTVYTATGTLFNSAELKLHPQWHWWSEITTTTKKIEKFKFLTKFKGN